MVIKTFPVYEPPPAYPLNQSKRNFRSCNLKLCTTYYVYLNNKTLTVMVTVKTFINILFLSYATSRKTILSSARDGIKMYINILEEFI